MVMSLGLCCTRCGGRLHRALHHHFSDSYGAAPKVVANRVVNAPIRAARRNRPQTAIAREIPDFSP